MNMDQVSNKLILSCHVKVNTKVRVTVWQADGTDCCSKAHLPSVLLPRVNVIPADVPVAGTSH